MDIDTRALLAPIVINGHTAETDFIHVTEFERHLLREVHPRQTLRNQGNDFANGSLRNIEQAVTAMEDGADIVAIAREALAGPIANIKESELAM